MKIPVLNFAHFKEMSSVKEVYVNTFSTHLELNEHLIHIPHRHDFYLCVLFTKGAGVHEIDFNAYKIQSGKVFFLKPGQTHYWKFETKPEGFIFFHSQAFYELHFLEHRLQSFPFFYSLQNPPVLQLSQEKLLDLSLKFQELYIEYLEMNVFREVKIVNLMSYIYIELTRVYSKPVSSDFGCSSNYYAIFEKLEALIDHHFYKQKLPKFYAEKLCVSTKHLNRIVKETINKTTSQLISERVILEAKRLLVHSKDQLTEIGNTLGFSDDAYFSKYFKSKTGITPSGFRKKYMGW
ncbi:Transcriptional regulator, AraC family [Xanthomarina gelatinilytica]|uniref:Transcriptional regulator, AraC family n=1 Tax=Xanthomarina gelatinilytica TaxID=1137281 RepID=M7MK81_9FLAO|nr:helix-turn-helix domain-containing protein [Xanthomarina gelatinilytica]EMQ95496.1 Transcriptional regulator, AraC family [Xanthomarina gelatinilytica]